MSWSTAVSDLRRKLADNTTDKLSWRKTVFGQLDGTNHSFKTYERRRVTDFSTIIPSDDPGPVGVYVDNIKVQVTSDDVVVGQFVLETAPNNGSRIEATYYNQWF